MKNIFSLAVIILGICCMQTQPMNSYHNKEDQSIQEDLIKNITLAQMYYIGEYLKGNKKKGRPSEIDFSSKHLSLPGFGFQAFAPNCKLQDVALEYPDNSWQLKEISFPKNKNNNTVNRWGEGNGSFIHHRFLIGVNENKEIKFISGTPMLEDDITTDFSLNEDNPNSYIPFLKFRWFRYNLEDIKFSRREGALFVYQVTRKRKEGKSIAEYFMDPKRPGKFVKNPNRLTPPIYGKSEKKEYERIDFKNFETKRQLMLDALMKNLYLNKVKKIFADKSFEEIEKMFVDGRISLDIIPAYNEYLGQIRQMKQIVCRDDKQVRKAYFDKIAPVGFPIFEDDNTMVVFNGKIQRRQQHIEFYAFYRDTSEVLYKNDYTTSELDTQEFRYTSDIVNRRRDQDGIFLPPQPIFDPFEKWKKECRNSPPDFNRQANDLYKHYLLAYNTKTNNVYFVSGDDIFLSSITPFYTNGKVDDYTKKIIIDKKFLAWDLENKLAYIEDRAYAWQVENITPQHITYHDEHKLIIEAKGYYPIDQVDLKIELKYSNPEIVDITIK